MNGLTQYPKGTLYNAPQDGTTAQTITTETIQAWLISELSQQLDISPDEIDIQEPFDYYGLSSREAVSLSGDLQEWLGRDLSPTLVWEYPNIESLARYLAGEESDSALDVDAASFSGESADHSYETSSEPIAIIGLGCRFPGANDPQAFWHLLHNGQDAIREVPAERWELQDGEEARWGGFLEQVDQFDAKFFSISRREAKQMDPQQRLLLEVSWEALEQAGVAANKLAGTGAGVFIGISSHDYSGLQDVPTAYTGTGNAFSIAANRLSYLLDLRGPSWAVDTACSSSLVAVHQAVMSLRQGECSLALAGGVNLILSPYLTMAFSQAGMMAADGRCKTFDASADGYVRGEGCGIVVLKRLSDAQRDGDRILALIRGSAVNQDGRTNGLTSPNGLAQQAVIRQALKNADVVPTQISYIEAHSIGTFLADPIEVNALKEVLMPGRSLDQRCFLGSAKTNIGHLEPAAGIAGLIKVVLSLQHEEIPSHLHLKELNPHISIEGTQLSIPTENQPWPSGGRLAGVSSFGFGGTNAHVILEEASAESGRAGERESGRAGEWESGSPSTRFASGTGGDAPAERPKHLLTLSAKSQKALLELARRYEAFFESDDDLSLADVCFTANTGRSHFEHRLALVAESTRELGEQLSAFVAEKEHAPRGVIKGKIQHGLPKIAFLFTGQGSQYIGMGQQLYETAPIFRDVLDRCDEILRPYLFQPLLSVLYPELGELPLLHETAYTEPALFALEYALAELWKSWGIEPDYVCGHDVGEYVAACVAGVFSLEDGLKLIAERASLMHELSRGGVMASLLTDFRRVVREIEFKKPTLNFISNLTGEEERDLVTTAEYWVDHVIKPVRFADGMQALHGQGVDIFIEIGPEPTLLAIGRQSLRATLAWRDDYGVWLPTLRHGQASLPQLLQALANLYVQGVEIDWVGFHKNARKKVVLPTYPFQRERYWIDPNQAKSPLVLRTATSILNLIKQSDSEQLVDWLSQTGRIDKEKLDLLPQWLETLVTESQRQVAVASPDEPTTASRDVRQQLAASANARTLLMAHLTEQLTQVMGMTPDPQQGFFDMGMDSLMAVEFKNRLESTLGESLSSTLAFNYPNLTALTEHLLSVMGLEGAEKEALDRRLGATAQVIAPTSQDEPIAIIGMACRFPGGANTPDLFWELLSNGQDGLVEVPAERWDINAYYDPDPSAIDKMYTRYGGFLPEVGLFDSEFFGISPREAMRMDPQQRLLLEVSWEALEHAGLAVDQLAGSATGVFIGFINNDYTERQVKADGTSCVNDPYFGIGSSSSAAAGRLSYLFDFQGPSMAIDTACSSSLVSLHLALTSLRNQESNLAIVGGVNVITLPESMINLCKMRMLSADGRCKTFDAQADGFALGEGCGVVVVKRLSDAVANGDNVLAIIHGSAVNEDGRSSSLTAPNGLAQQAVIRQALARANLSPHLVSYVETHGSGTALGDPIEVESLQAVLGKGSDLVSRGNAESMRTQPFMIGTVKTNLGHLLAGAGMAGLIKTVLSLQHRTIAPHLHLKDPNPNIAWDEAMLRVPTTLTPWEPIEGRRIAGVSSFGWSGTNAHVVLEEASSTAPAGHDSPRLRGASSGPSRAWQLWLLSAKSTTALDKATENLLQHLQRHPEQKLADVAYTLQVGRRAFNYRRMVIFPTGKNSNQERDEIIRTLRGRDPQRIYDHIATKQRPVTFMFPGLGDQYKNMAAALYQNELVFRQTVDLCCDLLEPELDVDLRAVIYPTGTATAQQINQTSTLVSGGQQKLDLRQMLARARGQTSLAELKPSQLKQTALAQPALFVIEYALAQLWMSWGIRPQAMIGYSLGEYVAACLAGVFSLADGLRLVARRAKMIDQLPAGAMLAVSLPEEDVTPLLDESLSLSAINGPMMCVVAGSPQAVAQLEQKLLANGVACRQLQTTHAFHSKMMESIQVKFRELMQSIPLQAPQIPYVSNVTGTWITAEQATDPNYWASHLRQPVRFANGVETIWQKQNNILLEVGLGQTLGSLALQHPARLDVADPLVLSSATSVYDQQPDLALLLRSLGQLWLAGVKVEWSGFYAQEQRKRIPLPTYPFEQQRYWIDYLNRKDENNASKQLILPREHTIEGHKKELAEWFYLPTWQRKPLLHAKNKAYPSQKKDLPTGRFWLLFVPKEHDMNSGSLGMSLVEKLKLRGEKVSVVMQGESFRRVRDDVYTIDPQSSEDYVALIKHLHQINQPPEQIVHLWSVTPDRPIGGGRHSDPHWGKTQQNGFYSLLFLAQALGKQRINKPVHLRVISNHMQDVLGGELLYPEKATLLGPCKVIAKEYEYLTCSSIDIVSPLHSFIDPLLSELFADNKDKAGRHAHEVVAYRGRSRWVQSFEPIRLEDEAREGGMAQLRQDGVYLVTGGFGGLGFALSKSLAQSRQAKLVLVSRTALPPRQEWQALLADETAPLARRIEQVLELEKQGAEVLVVAANVANQSEMQAAVFQAHERFGAINGVFHLAGVPGEGLMQFKTRQMAEQVLAPKVQGTLVLDAVLRDEPLDFMVLYSSSNAITGGLGEVDYSAANAFMDAFAHYNRMQRSMPTISINWGAWQWDAWQGTLLAELPQVYERVKQIREMYGISFDEGENALWRILATSLPQVLVLSQTLQTVISQSNSLSSLNFLEQLTMTEDAKRKLVYPRPNLRTPYVAPRHEGEEKMALIWGQSLGIEKVGIHDHFFELGGNSLIGMMIISRLEKEFDIKLSAAALYEAPTVSTLNEMIQPTEQKESLSHYSERGKKRKQRRRRKSRR